SSYYSCGVDSIIDLFDYAVCTHLTKAQVENKSELLRLLYECHETRQKEREIFEQIYPSLTKREAANQLYQHRLEISWHNNSVWDWLCFYDEDNWCTPKKGTDNAQLHGVPIRLAKSELDKELFGLTLLWKCEKGQCGVKVIEHLFPVNIYDCDSIEQGIN